MRKKPWESLSGSGVIALQCRQMRHEMMYLSGVITNRSGKNFVRLSGVSAVLEWMPSFSFYPSGTVVDLSAGWRLGL